MVDNPSSGHDGTLMMNLMWETVESFSETLLTLVSSLSTHNSPLKLFAYIDMQLTDSWLYLSNSSSKPPLYMTLIFTLSLLLVLSLMLLLYRHYSILLWQLNTHYSKQKDELQEQLSQAKSQLRKIMIQYRIVSNNREALQKALVGVKQDLNSEKEARFVREKYLNERVDKLEQDLDFKDQEIDELKCEIKRFQQPAVEDEDAWILSCGEINKVIRRVSTTERDSTPVKSAPYHSEDEEGYVSEESCDATADVFAEAVNVVYHELISDVNICTLLNDVDDLALQYDMTCMDCLGVSMRAIVRYLQTKNLLACAEKSFQKFGGLLAKFTITEQDQVHLLEYLEIACITESAPSRVLAHLKVVMALYKVNLLEPTAIIEWHNNSYHTEATCQDPNSIPSSPATSLVSQLSLVPHHPTLSLIGSLNSHKPYSSVESAFAPNRLRALMAHSADFVAYDAQIKALSKAFVDWLISSQGDDESIRSSSTGSLGEDERTTVLEDDGASQSSRSSLSSQDSQGVRCKKRVTFNEVIEECEGPVLSSIKDCLHLSDSSSDADSITEEPSNRDSESDSESDEATPPSLTHWRSPQKKSSADDIEIVFE